MLSRENRFHGRGSVMRVRGSRIQASDFTLHFRRRSSTADFRVAVVVSRKISKSAVVRNRIRRRLYESVRKQKLLDDSGLDVVFVVRNERLASLPADQLDMQIAKACSQAIAK